MAAANGGAGPQSNAIQDSIDSQIISFLGCNSIDLVNEPEKFKTIV